MRNDYVASGIQVVGITRMQVADKYGNVKVDITNKNTVLAKTLQRMAYALFSGSFADAISAFGTGTSKDGILMAMFTGTGSGSILMLSCTTVVAAQDSAYVVYSGSRQISQNGTYLQALLGAYFFQQTGAPFQSDFTDRYCRQTANIEVSVDDTISVTWTVSCSTT